MRKTVLGLLVGSAVFWAWRAHDRDRTSLAYDRFWIDHMPTGPKDKFNIVVFARHEHHGMFAAQTPWTGQWEAFRFAPSERDASKLELAFPATDGRETVQVNARKCNEGEFDYCLEVTGSSRGVRRYYSKREWDQSGTQDPLTQNPALRHTVD